MNLIEMKRYYNSLSEIRVKCPCSHTLFFPSYGPDVQVCSHCGHLVYRNDKAKFISLLKKELKVRNCQNVKSL